MEELNKTYNQLIALFKEKEPTWSDEKKHQEALKAIDEVGGLSYYVNLFTFELKDITPHAVVKTPARYFKKYEAAKIFQLINLIQYYEGEEEVLDNRIKDFTPEEIQEMKEKLKDLIEQYPEYAI